MRTRTLPGSIASVSFQSPRLGRTMRSSLLFLAFALFLQVGLLDASKAARRALKAAEAALEAEDRAKMESGFRTRRGKKVTEESQAMGYRNALFTRAKSVLMSEVPDMEEGKVHEAVVAALKARVAHVRRHGQGQNRDSDDDKKKLKPNGFNKRPIELISVQADQCEEGLEDKMDCSGEADKAVRRIDGRCNNKASPLWGSAGVPFRRLADPSYQDGVGEPLGGKKSLESSRVLGDRMSSASRNRDDDEDCSTEQPEDLPNPRDVSICIHDDLKAKPRPLVSHMVTQMGQFLDHDLTLTLESHVSGDSCCMNNDQDNCFAFSVGGDDDPFYDMHGQKCMEFTRSEQFCAERGGIREQFNAITAFVDASNVYGSDAGRNVMVRTMKDGLLKTDEHDLLPKTTVTLPDGHNVETRFAGDIRAIEMPGLASMHTLFVREHNRIAEAIKATGMVTADTAEELDELLYQKTRRAVIAEMQKIVYADYLPLVVGPEQYKAWKLGEGVDDTSGVGQRSKYDASVDPTATNEFSTAAYRFGHSMIQGQVEMWTAEGAGMVQSNSLHDLFFKLAKYEQDSGAGMDQILSGLINQASQGNDAHLSNELTEQLFAEEGADFGRDLAALNIQRGRDHGIPAYNDIRKVCNRKLVCSWDEMVVDMTNQTTWDKLKSLYSNTAPGNVDLFTAGLLEDPVDSGLVGPTFACIIGNQFMSLKEGDRFFFSHKERKENNGNGNSNANNDEDESSGLTDAQLASVRRRTLRDIICDNSGVTAAAPNVFLVSDEGSNKLAPCGEGHHELDMEAFAAD